MRKSFLYRKYLKRILDVILSLIALFFLLPVFVILSLLILCYLGSPILFVQERIGKNEEVFKMLKFRTMTDEEDEFGNLLPDDQRLTKFGKFLRSTSMDELPELINIVKGDMSFIGPRPLLVEYLPFYKEFERKRHEVRPGLSGLAQVNGRNVTPWDDRLKLDVEYVENFNFILDIKIFLLTVLKTLKRSDILVGKEIPAGRLDNARRKTNSIKK